MKAVSSSQFLVHSSQYLEVAQKHRGTRGNKMAAINRFEDLIVWQKARVLTKSIYALTRTSPMRRDFGLCDQIRRASVSIMSNIAEGFERVSPAEFHRFLLIAKGSCGEVRNQLYVALDAEYLSQSEFNGLLAQANEVARLINGLRASIDRNHKP
jgi:four helix bundle protein